jgi:DNA polymerase-3 subunit delta'
MMVLPWHQAELERLMGDKGRLPHALLIHGREGIGKLLFARAVAQSLLCENRLSSGVACGRCIACGWFNSANHPDFRLFEPASLTECTEDEEGREKKASLQIVIEQIREVPDFIHVSSHRGGAKVILIHPAEALNSSAANALLKSLEEPPADTHFLLVAHRVHYLLPTVKSRCQLAPLVGPEPEAAIEWLRAQGVANPALALAQTGNSPLLAQQLAGQDYWQQRDFLLQRIAERTFDPLLVAEQIRDFPVKQVVNWLQKWTFDLILQKSLGKVRYNPDYATQITALAPWVEPLDALRLHRETVMLQRVVNHPLNPRLFLERLLLDYSGLLKTGGGRVSHAA